MKLQRKSKAGGLDRKTRLFFMSSSIGFVLFQRSKARWAFTFLLQVKKVNKKGTPAAASKSLKMKAQKLNHLNSSF
jgi:hypothetical protein